MSAPRVESTTGAWEYTGKFPASGVAGMHACGRGRGEERWGGGRRDGEGGGEMGRGRRDGEEMGRGRRDGEGGGEEDIKEEDNGDVSDKIKMFLVQHSYTIN